MPKKSELDKQYIEKSRLLEKCNGFSNLSTCKKKSTFINRNFVDKLKSRKIVSKSVQARIRARCIDTSWIVFFLFLFCLMASEGRVDGNSSPRVRKFLFNVPFIPHFSYLLLPFYLPQKRGDLRIRRTLNFRGEAKADLKKFSKLRSRNREVTFMRCKELSKFGESRILRAKYLSR